MKFPKPLHQKIYKAILRKNSNMTIDKEQRCREEYYNLFTGTQEMVWKNGSILDFIPSEYNEAYLLEMESGNLKKLGIED